MLLDFLPESVGVFAAVVLIAVSFVGSFLTASMGIGGGMTMIAAMATFMPVAAIVPIHGVVQLGSNSGRAAILRHDIDWQTFKYFGFGSIFGIAIGGSIAVALPGDVLRIGLAIFIVYSIWAPKIRFVAAGNTVVVILGVVASFLTMFFGATGAFVLALLTQRDFSPKRLVATQAICMTAQHTLKIIAFGILGFAFAEWAGLVALMLVSGFAGTYVGSLVLHRMPAKIFSLALKTILTVLALNLVATALGLFEAI